MFPLSDNLSCKGKPKITTLLILLNAIWFAIELKVMGLHIALNLFKWSWKFDYPGTGTMQQFFDTFAMNPDQVITAFHSGHLWEIGAAIMSIFTSMFVHASWAHFAGNMLFLWVFGPAVEARFGHLRYLAVYLLGGLAAASLQLWSDPTSFKWVMGASGAIAAILAPYLWFWPKAKLGGIIFSFFTFGPQWAENISARNYIFYWILIQFTGVLQSYGQIVSSGIAYWEHVGGFAFGLVAAIIWKWLHPKSDVCVVLAPCMCGRTAAPDDFIWLSRRKPCPEAGTTPVANQVESPCPQDAGGSNRDPHGPSS